MAKIKFRTKYEGHERKIAPSGERIEIRHRASIGKDGRRELIKDRKVDIYSLIQSNREECEIENIIRRAVMGDYNALNQANGVYADVTGMPKSIAEAQQLVISLKDSFEKLPKEIKAKFEFNPEIYVAEFGSEKWAKKTGFAKKLEEYNNAQAQKAAFDRNLTVAVEKLATGEAITQKGNTVNE